MSPLQQSAFSRRERAGLTLLEMVVVLVIMVALGTLVIPVVSWMGQRSQRFSTQENLLRLRELLVNQYMVDMGELPRPVDDGTGARELHPQLRYLFVNPDMDTDSDTTNDLDAPSNALSGRRWNGPYIMHSGAEFFVTDSDSDLGTGTNFTTRYGIGDQSTRIGDPTVIDAYGNPIVIQEPDLDDDDVIEGLEVQHTRLVAAGRNGIIDTPPDVLMPTKAERFDDQVLFLFRHDEHGDEFLELDFNE